VAFCSVAFHGPDSRCSHPPRRRGRTMKRAVARALALGLILMTSTSAAADLRTSSAPTTVECQSSKPSGDPRWWSFRLDVDGARRQRCWYPGKPGKPKSELHWGRRPGVERHPEDAESRPAPSVTRGATHDGLADQCCWPPLEPEPTPPPPPAGPSFRQRWNDMLNDMAEPVTRWRGQLKDQHRFPQGD
jgi:hypothetical protein